MSTKKKPTFEESLERLEDIVAQLEAGDLPLDKAFQYYKEGMDLSLFCSNELKRVEKEVLKIQKNQDGEIEVDIYETNA